MDLINIVNSSFPTDGIYEVILGTNGVQKNLAPIGVIKEGDKLLIRLYKDTVTFRNLLTYPYCTINVVTDPLIFYRLLYDDPGSLNIEEKYGLPFISGFNVTFNKCDISSSTSSEPLIFQLQPFDYVYYGASMSALNRGDLIFIDFLVNLTRYYIYHEEKFNELCTILNYELNVIKKTSGRLYSLLTKGKYNLLNDIRKICDFEV